MLLIIGYSCTTTKVIEVPVETIKTEYIHDTRIDSVHVKDSIDRYVNGDSVYIYEKRTQYKYICRTDTVVNTDTIPKIVKVETVKEVEVNHIKWYQKVLMWAGAIALLVLLFF